MMWSNYYITIIVMTLPIILFAGAFCSAAMITGAMPPLQELLRVFDAIWVGAYLHFALILGGAAFAVSAFHDETDRQTLHHIFLQPIHRWMMPVAKLMGFMLAVLPVYLIAFAFSYLLITLPFIVTGQAAEAFTFARIKVFLLYSGMTVLALLLYSSIFLALSMFVRSIFYAFLFLGWEAGAHFMPDVLKNFTVSYYLLDMLPTKASSTSQVVGILSEGPSALQTTLVLLGTLIASHSIAVFMTMRRQCLYGTAG